MSLKKPEVMAASLHILSASVNEVHQLEIDGNIYKVTICIFLEPAENSPCSRCLQGKNAKKVFAKKFRILKITDYEGTVVQTRKRYIHDKAFLFLVSSGHYDAMCESCLSRENPQMFQRIRPSQHAC